MDGSMKLGVFTVLFGTKPFEEMLDFVVELGLDAVEIGTGAYPGNAYCNPAALLQDHKRLQAFRERNAGRLPTQVDSNMQAVQSTNTQLQAMNESLARDRDRKLVLERLYNDAEAAPLPPSTLPDGNGSQTVVADPAVQLESARAALAIRARDTDRPGCRRRSARDSRSRCWSGRNPSSPRRTTGVEAAPEP